MDKPTIAVSAVTQSEGAWRWLLRAICESPRRMPGWA
jgi:hypothetical protein